MSGGGGGVWDNRARAGFLYGGGRARLGLGAACMVGVQWNKFEQAQVVAPWGPAVYR